MKKLKCNANMFKYTNLFKLTKSAYFNFFFFRLYGENIAIVANEVGRKPPTFLDASKVANQLVQLDFSTGKIVYNRFKYFLLLSIEFNSSRVFYLMCIICLFKEL